MSACGNKTRCACLMSRAEGCCLLFGDKCPPSRNVTRRRQTAARYVRRSTTPFDSCRTRQDALFETSRPLCRLSTGTGTSPCSRDIELSRLVDDNWMDDRSANWVVSTEPSRRHGESGRRQRRRLSDVLRRSTCLDAQRTTSSGRSGRINQPRDASGPDGLSPHGVRPSFYC